MSVHPSPALVVPADLSIGDCVRKMRDHDLGSVLVVRGSAPHDLLGIFTERDLVNRIDEIQHGDYWSKHVSMVMSHPVITLSIYEIDKASETMIRCGIRHLPVVYEDDQQKQHLAGVISMRDLFKEQVQEKLKDQSKDQSGELSRSREEVRIAIVTRDPMSRGVLKTIFSQGDKAHVDELNLDSDVHEAQALKNVLYELKKKKPDVFVLDLDFIGPAQWAKLLQLLNHEDQAPQNIILFTPGFHEAKNVEILHRLERGGKITAFAKPINIMEVLEKARLRVK